MNDAVYAEVRHEIITDYAKVRHQIVTVCVKLRHKIVTVCEKVRHELRRFTHECGGDLYTLNMLLHVLLNEELRIQNKHWVTPFDTPKFHRRLFDELLLNLNNKFILSVMGPRRVGKTTMLKQAINHLVKDGTDPTDILYFSLDTHTKDLLSIYNKFIEELDKEMWGQYILIFDEIQYLDNWASQVKLLYDSLEHCKIVISGSSTTDLRRGKESLAGREIEMFLPPLNFDEYLSLRGLSVVTESMRWKEYLRYMNHQLPEMVAPSIDPRAYISLLVVKIISNDLVRLHGLKDTSTVDTIFRIICKSPGEVIVARDLSNELGVDERKVRTYLRYLEQALLIRKVYNYSRNARKSEHRHKRYYPYFTTLHWYVHPYEIELGKKAETEVAFQLGAEYFWNDRGREIDFIVGDELDIGVEVNMRNSVMLKHIRSLVTSSIVKHKFVVVKHGGNVDPRVSKHATAVELSRLQLVYSEYTG